MSILRTPKIQKSHTVDKQLTNSQIYSWKSKKQISKVLKQISKVLKRFRIFNNSKFSILKIPFLKFQMYFYKISFPNNIYIKCSNTYFYSFLFNTSHIYILILQYLTFTNWAPIPRESDFEFLNFISFNLTSYIN